MRRKLTLSLLFIALTVVATCLIAWYDFAKLAEATSSLVDDPALLAQLTSMYYRSLTPAIFSLGTTLVLLALFGFFVTSYYIRPIIKMHNGVDAFNSFGKTYTVSFEGHDQLKELNKGISAIAADNVELRRRLRDRNKQQENN